MTGYTISHRDAMERTGNWTLCRRALELSSFGLALVDIPPGESIPEHDETERDQEEVFVFLSGDGTMVLDGAENDAPAGTFVRVAPHVLRTVRNRSGAPVSVLIASAPSRSGYEPMGWN
jgi:mannose-6-phosphate isomerase-like protein (cupin superfamily)